MNPMITLNSSKIPEN